MKLKYVALAILIASGSLAPKKSEAFIDPAVEAVLKVIATIVGQINEIINQIGGAMEANAEYIQTYSKMNAEKMDLQAKLSVETAEKLQSFKDDLSADMFVKDGIFVANEQIRPGGLGASACMMNKDAKRVIQNRLGKKYFVMQKKSVIADLSDFVTAGGSRNKAGHIENNIINAALQTDVDLNPDDNDLFPVDASSVYAATSHILLITQPKVPVGLPDSDSSTIKMNYLASKEGYNNTLYSFVSAMMTDMSLEQLRKHADNGSGESPAMQRIRDFAYATSKKRALSDQAKNPTGLAMEEYNLMAKQMSYLLDEHQSLMNERKLAIAKALRNLSDMADKIR